MNLPKTIVNHPSVERVVFGAVENSDYKYWVELKDGYWFKHYETQCKGVNSVKDFMFAQPEER